MANLSIQRIGQYTPAAWNPALALTLTIQTLLANFDWDEDSASTLDGNQPVLLRECFYDYVLIQNFLRAGPGVELDTDGAGFDAGGIGFAPVHYFYAVHRGADAVALR